MTRQWRLIKDGPGDPAWNMAVDEALVRMHDERSLPVLRLYAWMPPALSLGYFQKTGGIRFEELECLGIVPVRRITGGRAVLHYGDLTYSITISVTDEIPAGVLASYLYLCKGLLAGFNMLGINADLGSERPGRCGPDACFAVSTGADIVYKGRKFVGSAQKRIGSTLLQHGSILICSQLETLGYIFESTGARNRAALGSKITCLEDILDRRVDPEEVAKVIVDGFAQALGIEFVPGSLTEGEMKAAHGFVNKYKWAQCDLEEIESMCHPEKIGTSTAKQVQFHLYAPDAHQVSVAGDFNRWNTSAHVLSQKENGVWLIDVELPPGRYVYKFFVDGKWMVDPGSRSYTVNADGTVNCIMEVD